MKSKWTERYSCYSLRIGIFVVNVNWDRGGYGVSFNGDRLEKAIEDLDEAKAAGIKLARQKLTEALDALPGGK
jgi:hypothetical protein